MALGISEAVEISGRVVDLVKKGVTIGLQEEVMNLREAVLNARAENLALRQEKHELNERLAAQVAAQDRIREYELLKAPGGDFVYQFKDAAKRHYACPNCIEDRRVSILGNLNPYNGHYTCPNCKNEFAIEFVPSRPPPRVYTA